MLAACAVLGLAPLQANAQAAGLIKPVELASQRKPDMPWKTYQATTVKHLLGAQPDAPSLTQYGGLSEVQHDATGYFRVENIDGRWWMIDPDGHPLIRMSLGAVYRRTRHTEMTALPPEVLAHVQAEGGARWAADTVKQFRDLGVNSLGRWSEFDVFIDTKNRIPYTTSLAFMAEFGEHIEVAFEKYGHQGYRENCIPVFHPEFPAFCDAYAKEHAAPYANDPYLVGHYTDNEMPVKRNLLEITLALDPNDKMLRYNHKAAWDWLRKRRGPNVSADDITTEDGQAYLGYVYEYYYKVTTAALRKHDPNHLILGTRLHGGALKIKPVFAAAGKHLDVVSFNSYGRWDLSPELMKTWSDATNRPFVISEFCIKGNDSGLDNTKGAGWSVRTQAERGVWYQNFIINLLQSPNCVGWDYFKYRDDLDVNKGVLTTDFKPHPEFYQAMKQMHEAVYDVVKHHDACCQ